MVKFRYLIHKETGTVIKYEDWKEAAERDNFIIVKGAEVFVNPKNIVKAREMLFSDDFEIIYDSEFTYRELRNIFLSMNDKEICEKARSIMEFIQEHDPETVEKELDEIYKKRKYIESGVNNE